MHERSERPVHSTAREEAHAMLDAAKRIIAASRQAYGRAPAGEVRGAAHRDAAHHAAATVRPSIR